MEKFEYYLQENETKRGMGIDGFPIYIRHVLWHQV